MTTSAMQIPRPRAIRGGAALVLALAALIGAAAAPAHADPGEWRHGPRWEGRAWGGPPGWRWHEWREEHPYVYVPPAPMYAPPPVVYAPPPVPPSLNFVFPLNFR